MNGGSTRGLGPLQTALLEYLDQEDWAATVYEIAMEIFHEDDGDPPNDSETQAVYRSLKRLENRGLVRGIRTRIRDIGYRTAWRSLSGPSHRVFDPGG
ncbi:hypothetical protein GCM10027167_44280 [Nocardia heshunensis]